MMWQLIAAFSGMLLLCSLFIFWPRRQQTEYLQTTAQLFEERLQLLVLARDSGELAEQDFVSAANELKGQFLQQNNHGQKIQKSTFKPLWHLLLVVFVGLLVAAIYVMNGHYRQLADWQIAQKNLAEYGERALLKGEELTEHELTLFALGLRTKLADQGDDAMAWMLLGRVWMSQGLMLDAIDAYERALVLMPERTALLLSYSQALLIVGGEDNLVKAGRSIGKILMAEPDNTDAISLMALLAYERGDNQEAIAAWQLLLTRLTEDDPRYAAVQQKLSELGAEPPVAGRQVIVNLIVSPLLKQQYPESTLFLFARAVNGPPLPLAVQRIPLPVGAIQLQLTERMAMQAGWDLTSVDEIEVVARLSQAGTVEQREGDVQVVSTTLSFEQPVISIDLILEP